MEKVKIKVSANGPYLIEGECVLENSRGSEVETRKPVFALCRCGSSGNKPFCDGTHARIKFQAP